MKCPFCQTEMELGYIYGVSGRAVFWLPEEADIVELVSISIKRVKKFGGFVLDKVTKHAFIPKQKPDSYYCEACHALITMLRTQGEDTEPQGDSHAS